MHGALDLRVPAVRKKEEKRKKTREGGKEKRREGSVPPCRLQEMPNTCKSSHSLH